MPVQTQSFSPWLRSFKWDGFWILSGFWMPTLCLLLPQQQLTPLILLVTLCFWIAHRISSIYLGLCLGEYRTVLQAKPGYFFIWPLCLLVAIMAFTLCPESIIPIPRLWRFVLLGFVDYFFSLYHFSVQHYGVLSVYRGKLPHGQRDPSLLKWDWWLCIGVSGILALVMDYLNGELHQLHLFAPDSLPLWSEQAFLAIKLGMTLLVVLFWSWTLRLYRQTNQGAARQCYVSTLCYMTIVSFFVNPFLYFAIVQMQHWFVSLGLTTHMAQNAQGDANQPPWYHSWAWVNRKTYGPLLVLVGLSICLTPFLEADYFIVHDFEPEALMVTHYLIQLKDSLWIYVFGGLAFFSSFLHYIYDRGVFRFADPETRKAALKLLKSP